MRNKYMLIGVGIVVGVLLASVVVVLAGSVDSPAGPTVAGGQMYTLEQIYDRLDAGTAATKMTSFTEPSSGPGSTMHTLDKIMTKAPEVDDTDGAGVADVASGKKFWGLTSGAWGLQTGTATGGATYEAGVPKTGQTTLYRTGDDGDLEKGVSWPSPRFTDNGVTITDNLTGLMWTEDAYLPGAKKTWNNAIDYCNGLDHGGHTDWRLPNVQELQSLIDYGRYNPALPSGHPFDNVQSSHYWSSTTYARRTSLAWFVHLYDGYVSGDDKTNDYYVWPVRGGQ